MKRGHWIIILVLVSVCASHLSGQKKSPTTRTHDFHFASLARSWDEGIPLGNGLSGALVWQRDSVLRISIDRADLWDLRDIKEFRRPEFQFSWVVDQATSGDYKRVQDLFDIPYNRDAAPTKLPGAALELPIPNINDIESVDLRLGDATCVIRWKSGIELETFVHAVGQGGLFRINGLRTALKPRLIAPPYSQNDTLGQSGNSGPGGNDLRRLGYPPPKIVESEHVITYRQQCWKGFAYDVRVTWNFDSQNVLTGNWQILPNKPYRVSEIDTKRKAVKVFKISYEQELEAHRKWWRHFWNQSSIHLPDSVLETQWYREMYKFGSASRRGAPPITLQAVWTADNGRLPPWKGDFHHDLNTELSYWPSYSSNHLDEEQAFLDWLWWCKPVAERYTRTYFGTSGLDFPGVSTLTGEPMGGWIQYSLSPTVSSWLAQHFYLHWRYSLDRKFLKDRAYPWIREVAVYIDQLSERDSLGKRKLPLSSSPEINDNRVDAWFHSTTNYDLALIRWLYGAAEELALDMGNRSEAEQWKAIRQEWPDLAVSAQDGKLLVAPGIELKESHRHFSHLMAIHPLGLLDWDRGEEDRRIISASLADLERLGTDWWCGYSYAWFGNMWARAHNGEKAAEALRTFAACFCLPNSFHVNGDQSGTGKSKFTYRPFTLEGNFACAEGIQEMLLQSQNGLIRVFPAVPDAWENVSFINLRAEGALLVSATRRDGRMRELKIVSEKGGTVRLSDPFAGRKPRVSSRRVGPLKIEGGVIEFESKSGGIVAFSSR